jgi:hypothetical protein
VRGSDMTLLTRLAVAQTHIVTWQEQEISNVVWAMATLSRSDERMLDRMARDALRRGMSAFVPQAVSNMVWGFAVLEYNNNAFMLVSPCRAPFCTYIEIGLDSVHPTSSCPCCNLLINMMHLSVHAAAGPLWSLCTRSFSETTFSTWEIAQ